ncbi:uncharacterized protein LOC132053854 [Lycium ferocissimum]|uniref:uncharacterized protein LOC132053854 n=1 Tax=Lycium ferocissimum TaxID=112874 RepID=UPI0028158EDB|nr:uncharacterized protein LOC132053854 [Lycium ferocissimum]
MVNKYKLDMVAISEPLVNSNKIEGYKRFLGFKHCISNINGKIWCFWRDGCVVSTVNNHEQQITLKIQKNNSCPEMYVTAVYAKCTPGERMELWRSLNIFNRDIKLLWCVGGDFSVILHPEEKIGGLPHRNAECYDFYECIDSCGMVDIGYSGSNYTCSNTVKHLSRVGSDHRPLFLRCKNDQVGGIKYFKFLEFWTSQEDFLDVVRSDWNLPIDGNPMWRFHQKLKRLGRRLATWSRNEIGDVHENAEVWENKMQILEDLDMEARTENSREELNRGHAEYMSWSNKQDGILKQKSQVIWFEEGDSNTKYFHIVIRDRRRKLKLERIKNNRGR